MNTFTCPRRSLIAICVTSALLAACSAAPTKPDGAENLRSRLTQLQSNPQLASAAPLAVKDAELAVSAAEKPQGDKALAAHLVFLADRKIDLAQAQAENQFVVEQRKTLLEQRETVRLQARTAEADSANQRAIVATAAADDQKRAADAAHDATADAQRNTQELQKQIDDMQAKVTERGLVLTLGDVLFASGTAELNAGSNSNLAKLTGFLNRYPERTVQIEGHTDNIGTADYNQGLSQRRADAVKSYLVGQGIGSTRLTASGKGKNSPVADNGSAVGRQQNRRVEVIIENNLVSAR